MKCRDYNLEPCGHCIYLGNNCNIQAWYDYLSKLKDINVYLKCFLKENCAIHPAIKYIRPVLKTYFPEHSETFEKLLILR